MRRGEIAFNGHKAAVFCKLGQSWHEISEAAFYSEEGVAMGQISRIVTAIEVTVHDPGGDPIETHYYVRGERYETLKQAMEAAEKRD